jgi:hypothetical protein
VLFGDGPQRAFTKGLDPEGKPAWFDAVLSEDGKPGEAQVDAQALTPDELLAILRTPLQTDD